MELVLNSGETGLYENQWECTLIKRSCRTRALVTVRSAAVLHTLFLPKLAKTSASSLVCLVGMPECTETQKKADEAKKKAYLQADYRRLLGLLRSDLYYFDRETEFGEGFECLISRRSARDRDGDVDTKTVELLKSHRHNIAVFHNVRFDPLDVIRRVWGPFDYAGDEGIEEIRCILFRFAEQCRRNRWGYRRRLPVEERQEMINTFNKIFVPLDRANVCLRTASSRLRILEELQTIEKDTTRTGVRGGQSAWYIPLSKRMTKRFTDLNELIDKLGIAQIAVGSQDQT
jgi:hypothetical protein